MDKTVIDFLNDVKEKLLGYYNDSLTYWRGEAKFWREKYFELVNSIGNGNSNLV